MKDYCILSIKKIHSMGSLQSSYKHNFREMPLKHVDISMSVNNEELINESGSDYRELWYRRIKEAEMKTGKPISIRKDSVLAYEIVTSFSRDAQVDMEKWKEANVQWMRDTFGEENILSMQLHEDETTPHIHTIVVPIDDRGKLCAKSFTGGRGKMFALQTSYGKAMKPLGLDRGEMYSRTQKEDLNRFYSILNDAVTKEAPKMLQNEKVDDYITRVNKYIQDREMEFLWIEKRLNREIELLQTKEIQQNTKYKEAISLQDDLMDSFHNDAELVKERIRTYRMIEKAVPRKILQNFLTNLLNKFPIVNNVFFASDKKEKKKGTTEFDL